MNNKFEKLAKLPFFTNKEANEYGLSSRMLSYYVKTGEFNRIARGVYSSAHHQANSTDIKWEDLAVAATNISGGVVCLVSALVYYELTDEIMKEFWIAVNKDNSKAKFPMTNIVRMRNLTLGVNEIIVSGIKIKIFDVERTLVDSFRLLDFETSMKALKVYLKGEKFRPDLQKLNFYIKELRCAKLKEFIMAVIA